MTGSILVFSGTLLGRKAVETPSHPPRRGSALRCANSRAAQTLDGMTSEE
jgi:hypothetical protein